MPIPSSGDHETADKTDKRTDALHSEALLPTATAVAGSLQVVRQPRPSVGRQHMEAVDKVRVLIREGDGE